MFGLAHELAEGPPVGVNAVCVVCFSTPLLIVSEQSGIEKTLFSVTVSEIPRYIYIYIY